MDPYMERDRTQGQDAEDRRVRWRDGWSVGMAYMSEAGDRVGMQPRTVSHRGMTQTLACDAFWDPVSCTCPIEGAGPL